MATLMNKEELEAFYGKLAELTERGTEGEVREYVNYHYPRLPEDVRNEILFNTLHDAIKDEIRTEAAILKTQEEGLAAADKLEKLKIDLEKGEKSENA